MASSRPQNSYAHPQQHHTQQHLPHQSHQSHQSVSHHHPHHHHQSNPSTYLPNGGGPMNNNPPPMPQPVQLPQPTSQHPGAAGLPPNTRLIEKAGVRILCIADIRGSLRSLNELAKAANADHVIHTGDFGFYDATSLERIADKTLRHVAQYSPLLTEQQKKIIQTPGPAGSTIKQRLQQQLPSQEPLLLSELPLFLEKKYTLDVPVYTVWGACEDVRVLEKFRSGEYKIDKFHIIDEASSRLLDVGGVKLRLLGLGGAFVMHKLFDNGDGKTTIAGGQGTMWTTVLQMGELVDTAKRVFDPKETRILITHASPARDGILNQLAVSLKADFSISAGLHFRYGSSYNEYSVNSTLDNYRARLASSKAQFNDVWETVKGEVLPAIAQNPIQKAYLDAALEFVEQMPSNANGGNPFGGPSAGGATQGGVDESAFKNLWNFNLADAAFGSLILEIEGGRIGSVMKSEGFNFSHRSGSKSTQSITPAVPQQFNASVATPTAASPITPAAASQAPPPAVPATISPAVPTYSQQATVRKPQASGQNQASPSLPPADVVKPALPPQAVAVNTPLPPPTPAENQSAAPQQNDQKSPSPTLSPTSPATRPQDGTRPPYNNEKAKRGLYVVNVPNDEVRAVFPTDDQQKILEVVSKVSASNKKYFLVYFDSPETSKEVLRRLSDNFKYPLAGHGKLLVKEIEDGGFAYSQGQSGPRGGGTGGRIGMGESKWRGGSGSDASRGGAQGSMRVQPGGSASESEGTAYRNRVGYQSGRGGGEKSRGPSGPGGYDSTRGGNRGRGSTRGRGRGGYKGEDGGPPPAVDA